MLHQVPQHSNVSEQDKHIPAGRKHGRPDTSPSAMHVGLVLFEEEARCVVVAWQAVHLALLCANVDRHCVGRVD